MPIWLINLIVGLVLNIGVSLLEQAISPPSSRSQERPGIRGTLQAGGSSPLSFVMGTYGIAGHLEYAGTWGNSGGTPNENLTHVISFSDLPITGLTALWVNGEKITLNAGTKIAAGYPAPEFNDGADNLWVDFLDGTQTTANSFLTSSFGTHPDRPIISDMIWRGVAYATMTARINRELFTGIPTYMAEVQGIPLYDVRKDGTAGGTGTHRLNDSSSWEFSDNPVVMIYNILTGITYGGSWVWGLQDQPDQSRLPYASWSTAMDACDASITLKAGGTEKQFRAGCYIDVDMQPIDVINDLLTACSGRMTEIAGVYKILVGAPGSSVASVTDDDFLISEVQSLSPFPPLQNTINGITATYPEPLEAWEMKEAPPRYSSTLENEDDGRRLPRNINLKWVFSGTQAQRITKAMVEEARRFRRHVGVLPPKHANLEPLDVISWTSSRNGYSSKLFLVTSVEDGPNANVVVGLQEIDASDYSWTPATDEQASSVGVLAPSRPAAQTMSGWTVNGATIKDDAGSDRRPTLQIGFSGPQADVKSIGVQVRLKSSGAIVFDGEQPFASPYSVQLNITLLANTEYEARGKYIPFSGRTTSWSGWLTATTPNVLLGPDDMDPFVDVVGFDALETDVKGYLDWVGPNIRELQEQAQALAVAATDATLTGYSQYLEAMVEVSDAAGRSASARNVLQANIDVVDGRVTTTASDITTINNILPNKAEVSVVSANTASITTNANNITSQADAITALSAATTAGDINTANFRMSVLTGPTGYSRIGFEARQGGAGTYRGAALMLDTPNDPLLPTRAVIYADQFIVTDGTKLENPFVFEGGVAKMTAAKVGTITSGLLQNASGSSYFNLDTGELRISV